MVPFAGWNMPVQYRGIVEEHQAVRTASGLFDISHMGRLSFNGPDSPRLIDKIFTNSAAGMKEGQVRYGLVCNERGGTLDDVLVYRLPTGWSMVVNASNREKIIAWLQKHIAGLDVEVIDRTTDTAMLAVQGPKAIDLCKGLFDIEASTLKYYYASATHYEGVDCLLSRTGYTGEDGFEVIVPSGVAITLAEQIIARGVAPCGLGARDTLRLEAAMPLYGHELNETIDPIQAGLSWAVKLDKEDFIGKQALEAIAEQPTLFQRIGLELEGKRAAREGCKLLSSPDSTAGVITSGSYAPTLGKSIAMAYCLTSTSFAGSSLLVDIRGTLTQATVVALPFYRRGR